MRIAALSLGLSLAVAGCTSSNSAQIPTQTSFTEASCEVGIYGDETSFVAITKRDENYRYSFSDGRWGRIDEASEVTCGDGAVKADPDTVLPRRSLKITNTEFSSGKVKLAGQLLELADGSAATTLVVLAHGSEELGWIEAASYPYQFVGRGVSVFVYDKRGTGKSEGVYSQNFPQLADDLAAASQEAKRLAKGRYDRFGLFGFSQGGWIAPIAAERTQADFIGIGYGLVIDIIEEDASQVELEVREAGYDETVISKAKAITDITARLAVSGYSDGLEELDAMRDRYRDEPWFSRINGGFTGVLLSMSTDELRDKGIPMFDRLNIDWSIKPMDVLRDVNTPQLWVLAEDDREAPISKTLERLQTLRDEGKEIEIYVFPDTDHGMWEYRQGDDLKRETTRVTDTYYDLLADWAIGKLEPPYADSTRP